MIALTVDCEQWNCPFLEGRQTEENNETSFSKKGNEVILDLFEKYKIRATFFITGYFAEKEPDQVRLIQKNGHEIACHGYNHFYRRNKDFDMKADILKAKEILEKITESNIKGFRSPQMQYSEKLIKILNDLNFKYDSSLHPCWIPGHYNNLNKPIKIFKPLKNKDIIEIPASVSAFRMPISWLFVRLLGINRTIAVFKSLLKKGAPPVLYFHSWEFVKMESKFVPFYYNFRTGKPFAANIEKLICKFKNTPFVTLEDLTNQK